MTDQPTQRPYDQALEKGLVRLSSRWPSPEKCEALGLTVTADQIRVPVLGRMVTVDPASRGVWIGAAERVRSVWAVLVVHYLCAENVVPDFREVSFSYFQDCRDYLSVFGKRITARFLATSGRSSVGFAQLAEKCGGVRVPGPGTGYRFDVFPRVPITIVRYEGDEEVAAGASIVYRADAGQLLPAEDRVVAAELLLDALAGKPVTESGGVG
jgi:hypothetical protein